MISADEQKGSGRCAVCGCEGSIHVCKSWDTEISPGLFMENFYHYWFCKKHYNEFTGSDL
jgi:hypothetical protein